MAKENTPARVVIVGSGFGGITAAHELGKRRLAGARVTLVSEFPHFEFRPGLYQVISGSPARKVCIPVLKILRGLPVSFAHERIQRIDRENRLVYSESGAQIPYDYLVLALGSRTDYFGIPGIKTHSFALRTIEHAVELHTHIHRVFQEARDIAGDEGKREEFLSLLHFVVVGGGPAGVELAAELACTTKRLAKQYGVSPYDVTVDLIEAETRLLPSMREDAARRVERRLHTLGVNLFLERTVTGEREDEILLHGMKIETGTVVWTAGVRTNTFYQHIPGLSYSENGRVDVRGDLRARRSQRIFVIGDAAATPYAGLAQTAIEHGKTAAENIEALLAGEETTPLHPKKPVYALPVGRLWAAVEFPRFSVFGFPGWLVRKAADIFFFLSILPLTDVVRLLTRSREEICDECGVCAGTFSAGSASGRGVPR